MSNEELIEKARRQVGHIVDKSMRERLISDLADALEVASIERDDLATRLSEYLCDSTGGLLSKTGYDVRTMMAHTEEYYDRVHAEERKEVEAERDAALAAVERVAVKIEAVAGGITSSSEASGYRNGLLRAAQIVRTALDGKEKNGE